MLRAPLFTALLLLAACGAEPLDPPTPALISALPGGAGDAGNWIGDCPTNVDPALGEPKAAAPAFDRRLAAAFPVGSSGKALAKALREDGFRTKGACSDDPTIQQAEFIQSGGGVEGPYPAWARVHWKVDAAGAVVWAYGRIAYAGP